MALLLLIPVLFFYAEFRLFFWVAGLIGFAAAAGISILCAVTGFALVRSQGLATLTKAQEIIMHKDVPHELTGRNIFDAACLALAGLFFIIPGFLTDILALLLLIPGVRSELFKNVGAVRPAPGVTRRARDPNVIEGEFTRLDE